jgi:hypothetical protein
VDTEDDLYLLIAVSVTIDPARFDCFSSNRGAVGFAGNLEIVFPDK